MFGNGKISSFAQLCRTQSALVQTVRWILTALVGLGRSWLWVQIRALRSSALHLSHQLVTGSKSFIIAIGNGDSLALARSAAADSPQSIFEMFRWNVVVPCGKQTASGSNITHLSQNVLPCFPPVLPSSPVLAVSLRSHPRGPVLKSTRCHHLSDVLLLQKIIKLSLICRLVRAKLTGNITGCFPAPLETRSRFGGDVRGLGLLDPHFCDPTEKFRPCQEVRSHARTRVIMSGLRSCSDWLT